MSDPFIAEIKIFAGNFAPRGFAFCNGQLLPIAQNTALFALVGTIYGGDGRTTLGLPDLQSRLPMHPGNGPGLTSRRIGERGGSDTVTLTDAQVPPHLHAVQAADAAPTTSSPTGAFPATAPVYEPGDTGGLVSMSANAMTSTGSGGAHNNQQPYLNLGFIIALVGIFPSRN
jgi:microcystin-dependent protein